MRRGPVLLTLAALVATLLSTAAVAETRAPLLCDKTWAAPGTSGVWDQSGVGDGTESQWTPAGVPTAGDHVCLPAGDYTVTVGAGDGPAAAAGVDVGTPAAGAQPVLEVSGVNLALSADSLVHGTLRLASTVDVVVTVELAGPGVDLTTGPGGVLHVANGAGTRRIVGTGGGSHLLTNQGTFTISDAASYTDVPFLNQGQFTLEVGRTFLASGGTTQSAGRTLANARFTTPAYVLQGGVLGGQGQVAGDVMNSGGTIDAGNSPGFFLVDGNLTQTAGGTIRAEIEGDGSGVGFDHVHVNGDASLAGTLLVEFRSVPTGAADLLYAQGTLTGDFTTVVGVPADWIEVDGAAHEVLMTPGLIFSDVGLAHPFFADITWLSSTGITTGFPDGTYRPTSPVTRQSMAAFLYRLAGEPAFTPPGTPSFSDVPSTHPFFAEIEWLASTGITTGFPDGTFRPAASVTRQSMAAFLYRLAGEPAFTPPGTATFPDVATDHPFFAEIEWLASTGVTTGYPDGTFRPAASVTRQSMAAFLHRYVDEGLPIAV